MSEQTRTRVALDLEDLERQLRQAADVQPRAKSSDPLADLARIVGQDDPFKTLFKDQRPAAMSQSAAEAPVTVVSSGPRRVEPVLDTGNGQISATVSDERVSPVVDEAAVGAPSRDMLDEFDKLLRNELRGTTTPSAPENAGHVQDVFVRPDLRSERHFDGTLDAMGDATRPAPASDQIDLDELSRQIRAEENLPNDPMRSVPAPEYPEPPEEHQEDLRSLEAQRPKKGLVIAGVLLGIAALGVGAVVGLRALSGSQTSNGEPPIIKAEAGPTKVQPQNPGGVEIPNQNKQIYERTPEPRAGESRVVVREEQPIDVQASARAAARVILPGPGAVSPATGTAAVPAPSGTPPVASAPSGDATLLSVPPITPRPPVAETVMAAPPAAAPTAALGEPRRVRTIAVRPDGTIAPAVPAPQDTAPIAVASAPVTRPATAQTAIPTPPRPPAVTRPAVSEEAPQARATPPRQQVAAAPATTPSATLAPRTAEPSTGGGFMVQLGAPGSEAEARATFASLQRRFGGQLANDTPVIRRADVGNGRTVYRLRVGPFSREEAAEKCQALQASGGQCFIARN